MEKKVIIIGAGLVGSLWAIYLSKAGYKVIIYERRPDIRNAEISAGKSVKLFSAELRFISVLNMYSCRSGLVRSKQHWPSSGASPHQQHEEQRMPAVLPLNLPAV